MSPLQTGFTALHVAALYGQIELVREMLTKVPATVLSEPPHSGDPSAIRDIGQEVRTGMALTFLFSNL